MVIDSGFRDQKERRKDPGDEPPKNASFKFRENGKASIPHKIPVARNVYDIF